MMGGLGGPRHLLESETSKPKNVGPTLRRFGTYFKRYWLAALGALALIVVSTWIQVHIPDLIGEAIDCYLFPNPLGCAGALATDSAARLSGLAGTVGWM